MSTWGSLRLTANCRNMIRTVLTGVPLSCLVRQHQDVIVKNIVTTTCVCGGYRRYDRTKESVRKPTEMSDVLPQDDQMLPITKIAAAFPTLETHSQTFNGIKFTDLPVVHVRATSNNTIISVSNGKENIAIQSGGTVGFRNAKKGTNVAAQAVAIAVAGDALRKDVHTVRVCLKGIGPGRLPALKALQMSGLNIVSVTDTTPLAHNGNRPKKARRL